MIKCNPANVQQFGILNMTGPEEEVKQMGPSYVTPNDITCAYQVLDL